MRPLTGPGELTLFSQLAYVLDHELADDFAAGRRRPEWSWVALRGERLLARLAWWSHPGEDTPFLLDFLDVDETVPDAVEIGVHLLRTAMAQVLPAGAAPPEYIRYVPCDWHENEAAGEAVRTRMSVVQRVGARLLAERLRFEWRPGTAVPEPSTRLVFREPHGTEEVITLMAAVLEGSLDADDRDALTRMSPREAALRHYDYEIDKYTSPRSWWRVATLPDGEPVGFVFPSRNQYNAAIGYTGVVPAHRGQGYVDDILAEATRLLAAQGVPRVRAATDTGNLPMAAAFRRAGYVNFERAITLVWPPA